MAYMLMVVDKGTYSLNWEWLDGDVRKVEVLDKSPEMGILPPENALGCGRAIDPTHLVTRLRPLRNAKKIPDIAGMRSGYQCSAAFMDMIEQFEPGVHAFYPVTHEWKNGDTRQTHFVILPQQARFALHPNLAYPPKPTEGRLWSVKREDLKKMKRILSKDLIGGAHFWSDPQQSYAWFVSDELGNALMNAKLTGFELHSVEEAPDD